MESKFSTREEWLTELVSLLSVDFVMAGFPLPPIRISVGFPRNAKRAKDCGQWGECCKPGDSPDGTTEIFITPSWAAERDVAALVCHQLCHAADNGGHCHCAAFRRVANNIGILGDKYTVSDGLYLRLGDIIDTHLGIYPHAGLSTPATPEGKQPTRMIKVYCPECKYLCRVTARHLDAMGTPWCPGHPENFVRMRDSRDDLP